MESTCRQPDQKHLAWHETLEMHELAAFQANHLTAFKMHLPDIKDRSFIHFMPKRFMHWSVILKSFYNITRRLRSVRESAAAVRI